MLRNLSSLKNINIQKSYKGNYAVLRNRDDYIKHKETLISYPAKSQKLMAPENKDQNFMVKEKRLVDNLLDTLYKKNAFNPCNIKTKLSPDN